MVQGMSYWTYTDLFEEPGPPPTPFHGGFGLINREGIRKPAFFAYKYLHALRGKEIPSSDAESLLATDGATTSALIWDWEQPAAECQQSAVLYQARSNSPMPTARLNFKNSRQVRIAFRSSAPAFAPTMRTRHTSRWEHPLLSASQLDKLQSSRATCPKPIATSRSDRAANTPWISMRSNDVVLVELKETR